MLLHRVSTMLDNVKKWLTVEAEPLFTTSQQGIQEQIVYPDIVVGALDCVANTALLTINRILRFCNVDVVNT
jgi:hypothetical protein